MLSYFLTASSDTTKYGFLDYHQAWHQIMVVTPLALTVIMIVVLFILTLVRSKFSLLNKFLSSILLFILLVYAVAFSIDRFYKIGITEGEKEFELVDEFLNPVFNTIFIAILVYFTFDAFKRISENRNRQERLDENSKFIEMLNNNHLNEMALRNSENLFKDIFQDIQEKDKQNSSYISNLEIYGRILINSSDSSKELANLRSVEGLYSEIFEKSISDVAKRNHSDNNFHISVLNTLIIKKRNNRQTVENFIRYAGFFNDWAEILIKLSSYVDKNNYLTKADYILDWNADLFDLADSRKNIISDQFYIKWIFVWCWLSAEPFVDKKLVDCLDFKLQNAKFLRLKCNYIHENNRIKKENPSMDDISKVEGQYYQALNTIENGNLEVKNNKYYLLDWIRQYKCQEKRIDEIIEKIDRDLFKSYIDASRKSFSNKLSNEVINIYFGIALNRIRYVQALTENNKQLSENNKPASKTDNNETFSSSITKIDEAFGKVRSLVRFEQSWQNCISFYDNMGIYLTEKGRYEISTGNINGNADKYFRSAIKMHSMVFDHLTRSPMSDSNNQVLIEQRKQFDKINQIVYLRNLINLGRAHQCLYNLTGKKNDFKLAKDNLSIALELATQTYNFIYQARAHQYLGELYMDNRNNYKFWNDAIIEFRCSLETFTKDEYAAYHNRICRKLANFYAVNYQKIDQITRNNFGKSFGFCPKFENKDECCCFVNDEKKSQILIMRSGFKRLFQKAPGYCIKCPEWTKWD